MENSFFYLSFLNGFQFSYELATLFTLENTKNKKKPNIMDYRFRFNDKLVPNEDNDDYRRYTNDIFDYYSSLEQVKNTPYRYLSEYYSKLNFNFLKKLELEFGININYNSYYEKVDFDLRSAMFFYFDSDNFFLYLKGGKYSQLMDIYIEKKDTVVPQEKKFRTPYSYHINSGLNLNISVFNIKLETHYKYFTNVNSSYYENNPDDITKIWESSPPDTESYYYGFEFFLKKQLRNSHFGWFSYSWNGENSKKFTGYMKSDLFLHVFKLIYSFKVLSNLQLGINISIASGDNLPKYYIKKYKDNLYSFWIDTTSSHKYPWKFYCHLRLDWIILKKNGLDLRVFFDVQNIHSLFIKNLVNHKRFNLDRNKLEIEKLEDGSYIPYERIIITASPDERILPTIGLILKI